MAVTDSPADPQRALERQDAVFKALAHPTRRHILLVLHFRGGEMAAGDIASRLRCAWPTATRHLQVLREAGLVRSHMQGRRHIYRMDRRHLEEAVGGWIAWFRRGPGARVL